VFSGNSVKVKAGAVTGVECSTAIPATTLTLGVHSDAGTVTASSILTSPSLIDRCSDILVRSDSTGGAGRGLTHLWSLEDATSTDGSALSSDDILQISRFTDYLAERDNPEKEMLKFREAPAGVIYTFGLTVTNWLGSSSSSIVKVEKSSFIVPAIDIKGRFERDFDAEKRLEVKTNVRRNHCTRGLRVTDHNGDSIVADINAYIRST
jgi:hypothetical protein